MMAFAHNHEFWKTIRAAYAQSYEDPNNRS